MWLPDSWNTRKYWLENEEESKGKKEMDDESQKKKKYDIIYDGWGTYYEGEDALYQDDDEDEDFED